jgi:nucleoside-diphosphate-sugar epimerase
MKVLFIGGTGNISSACTDEALGRGYEVFHLNRGTHPEREKPGVRTLKADIRDTQAVKAALRGLRFDSVVQFLAFRPEHVKADIEIFDGITDQYVLISTCSAYRKPSLTPVITEDTPLENPFWEYSRLKIACEWVLAGCGAASHTGNGEETARTEEKVRIIKEKARDEDAVFSEAEQRSFPYTIVRPSHTYDNGWIPGCFGSASYGLAWRMLNGLEVVVPGDGQSLWTLTHASDFAVGLVGLLGKREALGQAFHITSDEHLTWDAIHSIIGEALGVQPKIVHIPSDFIAKVLPERGAGLLGDKAVSVLFDNSKIRRFVPEFAPRISFAEGIHRSLAWFDAHPDLKVPDKAMNADMDAILERWQLCAQ